MSSKTCEVCGKPLTGKQAVLCGHKCKGKYLRKRFAHKPTSRYATVKRHRCATCGATITTRCCFACDMQARQQDRLELERYLKSENNRIRERSGNQSEPTEALGGESAQIRSHLHHPDVIASPNGCNGVRDTGARSDAPAKRRRKRDRSDTTGSTDKQRTAAG